MLVPDIGFFFLEIRLTLSVNPQFVETDIGTRVEVSCSLDCDCHDLTISPVWVSEDERTLPIGTTVSNCMSMMQKS